MPAEWEPHEATWLVWPKNKTTWPGRLLAEVEKIYLRMMAALLEREKVRLLVDDRRAMEKVLKSLARSEANTSNLSFFRARTVDTWIRDYGPTFVKRKSIVHSRWSMRKRSKQASMDHGPWTMDKVFVKWRFNAWGNKYADLARDDGVVDRIGFPSNYRRFDEPMVLEGGSIDVNGKGVLLTTKQCLLNPTRNPRMARTAIEGRLRKRFGIQTVVWLNEGIEGDDTDGHVDDIARFVNPTTIVAAVEDDPGDKNHWVLAENLEILRREKDLNGRPFKIVELPMPGRVDASDLQAGNLEGHSDSGRLPASYANFYIGNGVVLVPLYSHRNDAKALRILRRCFPGRKAVGIECSALVYGLGSIHCVTQQEPL